MKFKNSDSVDVFNQDVSKYGGYKYTQEKLSCKLAHERTTLAVM